MLIKETHIPVHHHPRFQLSVGATDGYITTITPKDYGDGYCLVGVPYLFVNVCHGGGHRFNYPFTPYEWLSALQVCFNLNEELMKGKREFTADSIKKSFRYYQDVRGYKDSVEECKNYAFECSRKDDEVYRVWSHLIHDGVEYYVYHIDNPPQPRSYRWEIQSTIGPKSI